MDKLKLTALIAVLLGSLGAMPALSDESEATSESTLCADGTPCAAADEEPSDEELEESCD